MANVVEIPGWDLQHVPPDNTAQVGTTTTQDVFLALHHLRPPGLSLRQPGLRRLARGSNTLVSILREYTYQTNMELGNY